MDARRLKPALALAAACLAGVVLAWLLLPRPTAAAPDPETIAASTLLALRDEGRIVPFSARYVAIVTAEESRLGLTARKTLMLPGTVRYGVDLGRLRREDIGWDSATRTLSVTLPPLELSGPDVDVEAVRETAEGGLLMALTGAEATLDEANRRRAQDELMRQAREPAAMELARAAAMRNVARSFALPLRSAGAEASVAIRFVDPAGREEASHLDRPRPLEQRLRDRTAGAKIGVRE